MKITSEDQTIIQSLNTGQQIRQLRKSLGFTQEQFSDLLWVIRINKFIE